MIRIFLLGVALIAGSTATSPLPIESATGAVYRMGGRPIGTYDEKRTQDASGAVVTTLDSDMLFERLGSKLELKSTDVYRESPSGDLLEVDSTSSSSRQPTNVRVIVTGQAAHITTTVSGRSYDRQLQFQGSLLGPDAAKRLAVQRLRVTGDALTYQTFSPQLAGVVTISDTVVSAADTVAGTTAVKVEQRMSGMPAPSTVWLDPSGWMVREIVPSPLGEIEALRLPPGGAAPAVIGAALPSEAFTRSIVSSNVRLPQQRLIQAITLKIVARDAGLGWPDFSADNQTVLEKTPKYVVLQVRKIEPKAAAVRPTSYGAQFEPSLTPNALLQSDDPEVRRIAGTVVKNQGNPWSAALALQRWTAANMRFDLGIAVVPASEVAMDRRGTCFGYSVLLGALARAAGIPSRVRIGLVYAGGIWGGHAWDEVLVGGRWTPIDAALYAPGSADAARFSVVTSSLASGSLGDLGGLGQILGNVDIRILDYTSNGKKTVVAADAKPYSIHANVYHDPWLGLSVRKPSEFAFVELGAHWPQTVVVAMQAGDGRRIEIHDESVSLPASPADRNDLLKSAGISARPELRRIAGRDVLFAEGPMVSGVLLEDRGSIWLVKATGARMQTLLDRVISSMSFENRDSRTVGIR
jgi:Transglutaminase-like superfamily